MSPSPSTTIVIISSSDLVPSDETYRKVISALAFLPDDAELRIRKTSTSILEGWVWDVGLGSDRKWAFYMYPSLSGESNFDRDRRLVHKATHVIAFFTEERFMEGGTGHVVTCAIENSVPVEAWVQHSDGMVSLVAEEDVEGMRAAQAWLTSRDVASMVLKFHRTAMSAAAGSIIAKSSLPSPKLSTNGTRTGSLSTASTGKARSRRASIFQVHTD